MSPLVIIANFLTARHNAPSSFGRPRSDLKWSADLHNKATDYANQLASINKGLNHSAAGQRPNQGENLYYQIPGGNFSRASTAWANEANKYAGEKIPEGSFEAYGHYTQ
ncbi:MAG: hypothetical protein Q9170_008164, partial [Blastenia crenularia]